MTLLDLFFALNGATLFSFIVKGIWRWFTESGSRRILRKVKNYEYATGTVKSLLEIEKLGGISGTSGNVYVDPAIKAEMIKIMQVSLKDLYKEIYTLNANRSIKLLLPGIIFSSAYIFSLSIVYLNQGKVGCCALLGFAIFAIFFITFIFIWITSSLCANRNAKNVANKRAEEIVDSFLV